jgi:subtilase family serine protease
MPSIAQIPQERNVFIPPTSIERTEDYGVRVHTNHLISTNSVSPLVGAINGFTPAKIAQAYNVNSFPTGGSGAIAIVDAYHYPTALNDFNTFATSFCLPSETSTDVLASSNTVFQMVYATGTKPGNSGSWSQEMAIDIEWAHAMAPRAKIYLVEAATSTFPDIMAAIRIAKALPGVKQVSTSFGGTEISCYFVDYDSALVQPGVTFFSASGDSPAARLYPALSQNVVSVGGTTLFTDSLGGYVSESIWGNSGCGPSRYEPRPVFQDSFYSRIGLYRGGVDLCAVADPNTGVAAYDSYPYLGFQGWLVVGGTSVACPIVAGIVNASGRSFDSSQDFNLKLYTLSGTPFFHQITSGSSGGFKPASPWSYASGLGSPNNLGAGL